MANTVKKGNTLIQLVLTDDWVSGYHNFYSCVFNPSSANDCLVLSESPVSYGSTSTSGYGDWPTIELRTSTRDTVAYYFKGKNRSRIFIDYSSCTFASASNAKITFETF